MRKKDYMKQSMTNRNIFTIFYNYIIILYKVLKSHKYYFKFMKILDVLMLISLKDTS